MREIIAKEKGKKLYNNFALKESIGIWLQSGSLITLCGGAAKHIWCFHWLSAGDRKSGWKKGHGV